MTNRMKAVSFAEFGGPEVLELVELDRPEPGQGEVLVRVRATSVNPADWKIRSGKVGGDLVTLPAVLGLDVSGVVERTGEGVTGFAPGDEVYGLPFPRLGGYAEYLVTGEDTLARKPPGLDHVHAAALPSAGLTAWQALVRVAGVSAGQRVLVHAAAGGVGHLAVQIAKARGAHVLGTASAAKHEFLRGLGIDEPIDYSSTDFAEAAGEVDAVLDLVGGDYGKRSLPALRRGGILLCASGAADPDTEEAAAAHGVLFHRFYVSPSAADLDSLSELIESERLRVDVGQVLPLAEAAEAHRLSETGRVRGKIVLTL
ncbi:NADP-dependent oxidoreductase [Amycolatopsis nigrescens]|uniref:NADP-dependent oxidoreductase n=1 Tax=Amycolatopsis nigrescens TaxID=381445 RepID=UPI000378F668|nr:NADP-dependent oxidoreductase [Amycolatopsis nigrescens]